jgi:murein DD-endopeptidase MepM/ murein hydrolase activator NlpD
MATLPKVNKVKPEHKSLVGVKLFLISICCLLLCCNSSDEKITHYNFASDVLLDVEDVEKLENEFESIIDAGEIPKDLKYFQLAIRYKDNRIWPYLKWAFDNGDAHLKSMVVFVAAGLSNEASHLFLEDLIGKEDGVVNDYAKEALLLRNDRAKYHVAFDTLPILDKRKFLKEPFLFRGVSDANLKLNVSRLDTSSLNESVVKDFTWPTRCFNDSLPGTPQRKNFWFDSGNSYHSGLDNSWDWPGLPVVAVMGGKVKLVWFDLSWGVMIAIESKLDGKWLTQIYGHLGNEIFVDVGEYVSSGQRIGYVGKGMTVTNGGYRAHLHYGIEKCKFEECNLSGYALEKMDWINPRRLLSKNH